MCNENPVKYKDDTVLLRIRLTPKASNNKILNVHAGELKVQVTEPPEKGKANAALIRLIAKTLKIAKSNINIISGKTSRSKVLQLPAETDLTPLDKYLK